MFTGLVEEVGRLARLERRGPGARAVIESQMGRAEPWVLGESVAVDGACLTVERILPDGFEADLSAETLAKTTIGAMRPGTRVHLERAAKLGGRMGGHVVLGHVDAVAEVASVEIVGEAWRTRVRADRSLARFFAPKGSVAVDGVSLTVNAVHDDETSVRFEVMLVPHTLGATHLADLTVGRRVNVEVDVFARYVLRQIDLSSRPDAPGADHADDDRLLAKLRRGGYA